MASPLASAATCAASSGLSIIAGSSKFCWIRSLKGMMPQVAIVVVQMEVDAAERMRQFRGQRRFA